ncbi:MAG TPA: hypothetical protein VJ689_09860 [Gaiellaceae bacterium]|nr:hypothetical protein [Gaiellaceae bacterium]
MRLLVLVLLVLCAAVSAASAAAPDKGASAGSFSVDSGRGRIVLTGSGVLVGRLVTGQLEIKDLSPSDRFSPRVLGVPRGKLVRLRGKDVGFYIPGGRYRIVVRGEGISLSARGAGVALLDGEPDSVGATGLYAVDDAAQAPLPDDPAKVPFGKLPDEPEDGAAKGSSTP